MTDVLTISPKAKPALVTLSATAAGRLNALSAAEPDDLVVERDGATALVDPVSLDMVKGSEIDFVDELAGAEFRMRNPNARSSCGCGVSFSV